MQLRFVLRIVDTQAVLLPTDTLLSQQNGRMQSRTRKSRRTRFDLRQRLADRSLGIDRRANQDVKRHAPRLEIAPLLQQPITGFIMLDLHGKQLLPVAHSRLDPFADNPFQIGHGAKILFGHSHPLAAGDYLPILHIDSITDFRAQQFALQFAHPRF